MIRPGFIQTMVRVDYRTVEGYTGTIEIAKPIATKETIELEVKAAVSDIGELIGTKIEV